MKIGLIACGKSKLGHEAPAKELYQGELFKKASRYCRVNYDMWFIISAKHGIIIPDEIIKPYNVTLKDLNKKEFELWMEMVCEQLKNIVLYRKKLFTWK